MRLLLTKLLIMVASSSFLACAGDIKTPVEVVSFEGGQAKITPVEVQQASKSSSYRHQNQQHQLEWISCQPAEKSSPSKTFLLLNRDEAGFHAQRFCHGWIAQVFLTHGYGVIGVNRPGFGKSTGHDDLGGEQAIAAMAALLGDTKELKLYGLWAVNQATILAGRLARESNRFSTLILGNGIYDAEIAHQDTADPKLKEQFDMLVDQEGEDAYELRSLAWDFGNLPKRIHLYHGEENEQCSIDQAREFRQSLAASQYQAELTVVTEQGAVLSEQAHLGVLAQIVARLAKP